MAKKIWVTQRDLCLVGILIYSVAITVIALANWHGAYLTVSQHIALSPASVWSFGVINTISTTLIAFCLLNYVTSRWGFSRFFVALVSVIALCLYLIGWFPDNYSYLSDQVHNAASIVLFTTAAVTAGTVSAVLWYRTNWVLKLMFGLFLVVGLFGVLTASFFFKFFEDNIFWVETFYTLGFSLFMLGVIYAQKTVSDHHELKYLPFLRRHLDKLMFQAKD